MTGVRFSFSAFVISYGRFTSRLAIYTVIFCIYFYFVVYVSVFWMVFLWCFAFAIYSVLWFVGGFLLFFGAFRCERIRMRRKIFTISPHVRRPVFLRRFDIFYCIWRLRCFISIWFLLQYGQFTRPGLCVLCPCEMKYKFPRCVVLKRPLHSVQIQYLPFLHLFQLLFPLVDQLFHC